MHPTIEQIRHTNWDRAYLWDVEFRDYDGVFPATDVRDDLWNVGTFDFNIGKTGGTVCPPRTLIPELSSVTFVRGPRILNN